MRAIMRAAEWNQGQLAERLGVTQATVSRWLVRSEPEGHRRDMINDLFAQFCESPTEKNASSDVPLMGYVGAGAEVQPEFEQVPPEGLDQIHIPFPLPGEMIALQIRGDSMLPVYRDGMVLIVYREQKRPAEWFFGREAVVRTADGRRFVKTVMRGNPATLFSMNAPPIENAVPVWLGEIFAILPRESLGNGG